MTNRRHPTAARVTLVPSVSCRICWGSGDAYLHPDVPCSCLRALAWYRCRDCGHTRPSLAFRVHGSNGKHRRRCHICRVRVRDRWYRSLGNLDAAL
jgi:hypothetical protein